MFAGAGLVLDIKNRQFAAPCESHIRQRDAWDMCGWV
jgi:hypothetical protein